MSNKLQGKVAIVTGSSSGLGRDLCFRLASKNCKLILADLDQQQGQKVCNDLNLLYPKCSLFQKCNVVIKSEVELLFQLAKTHFQRPVDILINNAGIGENGNFLDDSDPWRLVIDIDVNAVVLGTKLAINEFLKNNTRGVIINSASLAGLGPVPLVPVYAGAKAFVVNFTRSLASLHKHGIRINCVCPSFVKTSLTKDINQTLLLVSKDSMFQIKDWVPISLVTDAFMLLIEDESLFGQACRITFHKGIDFPFNQKARI